MSDDDTDTAALDAWLAEHLFDWLPPGNRPEGPQTVRITTGWMCPPCADHIDPSLHGQPPALSTAGAGMLLVLEALRERWSQWSRTHYRERDRFAARLGLYEPEYGDAGMSFDALATAIAALNPLAVAQAARAALEAR